MSGRQRIRRIFALALALVMGTMTTAGYAEDALKQQLEAIHSA